MDTCRNYISKLKAMNGNHLIKVLWLFLFPPDGGPCILQWGVAEPLLTVSAWWLLVQERHCCLWWTFPGTEGSLYHTYLQGTLLSPWSSPPCIALAQDPWRQTGLLSKTSWTAKLWSFLCYCCFCLILTQTRALLLPSCEPNPPMLPGGFRPSPL